MMEGISKTSRESVLSCCDFPDPHPLTNQELAEIVAYMEARGMITKLLDEEVNGEKQTEHY